MNQILPSPDRYVSFLAWMSLLLLQAAAGCASFSGPASASFASVTIKNHTPDEITAAAFKVFAADGYRPYRTSTFDLLFEKETSRATSFAREGFVDSYYGARTVNRVRAQIVSLTTSEYRVQCQAYMVTGGSDPFFQDEVPVTNIRSRPYQSLLNKVAKQLK